MPRPSFPIVGIGASAGGVEALEALFRKMPDEPGLGFVVVTHLSPDRDSLLDEVLARFTAMPVVVAADGMEVARNAVHILPASASLTIRDGRLRVVPTPRGRRERHPIDVFLASLALDCGDYAASVVLSGGDGDGTLGIKADQGARRPDARPGRRRLRARLSQTCRDSAISTGIVDFAVSGRGDGRKASRAVRPQRKPRCRPT